MRKELLIRFRDFLHEVFGKLEVKKFTNFMCEPTS